MCDHRGLDDRRRLSRGCFRRVPSRFGNFEDLRRQAAAGVGDWTSSSRATAASPALALTCPSRCVILKPFANPASSKSRLKHYGKERSRMRLSSSEDAGPRIGGSLASAPHLSTFMPSFRERQFGGLSLQNAAQFNSGWPQSSCNCLKQQTQEPPISWLVSAHTPTLSKFERSRSRV